jgi:hypothetical protein
MAKAQVKSTFLADLKTRIHQHQTAVTTSYQPLDPALLEWQPLPKEWNILQCFDHLNLTHDYYQSRIEQALQSPIPVSGEVDRYKTSFWGGIYMHFAFNPNYSFPTAAEISPTNRPQPNVLDNYLDKQQMLLKFLAQVGSVDLTKTPIPIEKGVKFNLGDCLKILVYHDDLHFGQAQKILAAQKQAEIS